ncbi:helix-turn-helix domain-containing protein [Pseudonocardia alaniniphila]|uniref:Helix-turn-helix domain-containing protein n=1 Tax=Pseudonocardia alaniniphila TaxID=75291 RepID=A0ABS9TLB4_9PSEU|nr:helix-turn-helix domain-containing protein [Pseudonocardia alaniniphila]MCH6169320.1 helix-turn-helix domain-containing protein [Pseudonocardia alaniniphila]
MTLLLDTASVPVRERADAARHTMSSALLPARVEFAGRGADVSVRIEGWQLGPGARLVRVMASGHRLTRVSRHVRISAPEQISLAVQLGGCSATRTLADQHDTNEPGELRLVDLTSPFDHVAEGRGVAAALYIDNERIGLSADVVRDAASLLTRSPLYDLVRRHLQQVRAVAGQVEGSEAGAMLGAGTVELVRALIVSAAAEPTPRAASTESLYARITSYMSSYLGDTDLSPARIAAEHNISVRYLHLLFAQQGLTVRTWLVRERLEGARRTLATRSGHRASIAAVGRTWGFSDAGHFARRFRAAYGMSPTEWRQLHRGAAVLGEATSA